ncbi:hypothetical protein B0O80DRAFT_116088 [Mortierella sp. GBAus27b]|nr:hypothetical protein B0O80DRAFT_116088 [Mortierella sp. GBAus27b]
METALVSREETIRGMETTLAEREKKISWEQQRLDDLRRNLVQEQERRQAPVLQRSVSEKHVEPMAIDQANVHDGVNGKSNTIFSSVLHPSSMTTTVSLTSSSNPLERYMGGRGMDTASAAEPAYTTSSRITSRRKTGLSAGRYSLQPPPTYRTTGTTGTSSITTFATQHRSSAPSSSEVLDTGSAQAAEQSSNMTSTQRLGTYESSNGLSDRRSTTPVSFSAQPHTFQGTGGKEFRPTGKYGTGQGLSSGVTAATSSSTEQQPYRRRSKSKSASSIIASLSSASLSGIAAALPSSGTTFAVPEPVKPTSSMAPPTFSFNFTPVIPEKALPSTTSGLNGQGSGSGDTQAAATTEPIPLQSTTLSNGTGFLRPAVPSGGSSRNMTGSSHPTTSSSSSSSSLATTNFAPRRAHTPGLTRFNITPASSSSTSKLNIGSTTLSTSEPTTTATMPSTSNVSSSQDRPSTPTKTQNTTSLAGDRVSQDTGLDRPSRQDYEDFRMEWDGDIPSPFIKKTFTARPPVSSSGGSAPRNLFGS